MNWPRVRNAILNGLFLVMFTSPVSGNERLDEKFAFAKSIELFKARDFRASHDLLSQLVRQSPGNSLYWFNLGNSAFMLEDFQKAHDAFLKVENLKSRLSPAARLYRTKSLRSMGRNEDAQRVLEQLKKDPSLPSALKNSVRDEANLLQALKAIQLENQRQRNDFWSYADFSLGLVTNPYLEAQPGGGSGLAKTSAGLGTTFWRQGYLFWIGNFGADWSETFTSSQLRVISLQASAQLAHERDDRFSLVGPFLRQEIWGNSLVMTKSGVRGRTRASWSSSELGIEAELASVRAPAAAASYLAGTSLEARFYYARIWSRSYGQLYFDFERQMIGDQTLSTGSVLPTAYQGFGPGGRFIHQLSEKWILSSQIGFRQRSYFNEQAPLRKSRLDQETNLSVKSMHPIGPGTSAYFSLGYLRNTSTLGPADLRDENYSSLTSLVGIFWDFER